MLIIIKILKLSGTIIEHDLHEGMQLKDHVNTEELSKISS